MSGAWHVAQHHERRFVPDTPMNAKSESQSIMLLASSALASAHELYLLLVAAAMEAPSTSVHLSSPGVGGGVITGLIIASHGA